MDILEIDILEPAAARRVENPIGFILTFGRNCQPGKQLGSKAEQ